MSTISSAQIRAARALLGWSQPKVGELSGVSVTTLSRFESGRQVLGDRTMRDIERVFEEHGIVFIGDDLVTGVTLRLAKSG